MMQFFVAFFLIFCSLPLFAARPVITLAADPWCPWDCVSMDDQGFTVDIARAIFEPLGYDVTFVSLPWTRAIVDVKAGKYTAIIGADNITEEVKTFIFPKTPVGIMNNVYVIPTESLFKYTTDDVMKGKRISIVANYHFGGALGKYIDEHYQDKSIVEQITGTNASEQNMRMVLLGRSDLYVDDVQVVQYMMKTNKLEDKLKIGGYLDDNVGEYIAFSPALANAKELAQAFDAGMKKLKENGKLSTIFAKYHARDKDPTTNKATQ